MVVGVHLKILYYIHPSLWPMHVFSNMWVDPTLGIYNHVLENNERMPLLTIIIS